MTVKNNEIELNLVSSSRKEIREELVKIFLSEEPGTGKKELSSKYSYLVETIVLQNVSHKIFLNRPAYLNKGFDFIVSYHGHNFNKGKKTTRKYQETTKEYNAPKTEAPSHNHICDDLELKRNENTLAYPNLKVLIDKIYDCKEVANDEYAAIQNEFTKGLPVELTLKLIKWLFIEQDITYWNFSGRAMLYGHINSL